MTVLDFCREWMSGYDRRLAFNNPENNEILQERILHRHPDYLAKQIEGSRPGCYMTAQPMQDLNHAALIERLFFDFDCEESQSRALKDAVRFQEVLKEWYEAESLLIFSGSKGYHVYVFLQDPAKAQGYRELDRLYDELMRLTLAKKGVTFSTFDDHVIDIKRQSRVPYSIHQKTGSLCVPVKAEGGAPEPYKLEPGFRDYYQKNGLSPDVVSRALSNIRRVIASPRTIKSNKTMSDIKPCLKKAIDAPDIDAVGHWLRVAAVIELQRLNYSEESVSKFFEPMKNYDREISLYQIHNIYEANYTRANCKKIADKGYCLKEECPLGRRLKEKGEAPWRD